MFSRRQVAPPPLKDAVKDKNDETFDFACSEKQPGKLFVAARAKIFWGELSSSVHGFLTAKGVPAAVADSKISEFQQERNREIRKLGLRSIFIGLGVGLLAGFTLYLFAWPLDRGSMVLANRGMAAIVVVALYGSWKIGLGLIYLIWPQTVRKSLTDIGESDIFEGFFDK